MKGQKRNLKDLLIDPSWTLFLDRDGVINRKLHEDYVKSWDEFEFLPGVQEALAIAARLFGKIFIVTNQQCVGRGILSVDALEEIHRKMLEEISHKGGRIDKIYFCPDLRDSGSLYRKPAIGMALQARREHPQIRFRQSVIAGDAVSDMEFGKKTGMFTALISNNISIPRQHPDLIDALFPDLLSFVSNLYSR
ncbi:MAG: HAD-IIIA family hydrolase [Bacteroidetes bacterium]|nr:HAD-IIIA family hydrolase [Bacteroidota bacterium]